MENSNEDDKRSTILQWLLIGLIVLWLISVVKVIGNAIETPQNIPGQAEQHLDVVEAIPSPLFVPTQVYGSFMVVDGEVSNPKKVDYEFMADRIILAESGNQMIWGDLDKDEPVFGVAQFRYSTWQWMQKESGMWYLSYWSADDQRKMLIWALCEGLGNHWTAYRNLYGNLQKS